jgi:hypothetical protein
MRSAGGQWQLEQSEKAWLILTSQSLIAMAEIEPMSDSRNQPKNA